MSEENGNVSEILLAATRISLGWVFFWAFLDKFFGLGYYWYNEVQFGTDPSRAYIAGGSPTFGFLTYGTQGKFLESVFQPMAGTAVVDFLFLFGLFGIGLSMLTGAGRKLGGTGGFLLMIFMWLAQLPLTNNPIIDDHFVYAMMLLVFGWTGNFGRKFSLAGWWEGKAPSILH
ncbi:MAG: hypothetical protein ACXAE3_04595 [Candidatus Kariarchaeaceae archaeon]